MPKLASKHAGRQQTTMLADFTGGLNTSVMDDLIGENQLSEMVNLEIDKASKLLRTVKGTKEILHLDADEEVKAAAWDSINRSLVLFGTDSGVYAARDMQSVFKLGKLNGSTEPVTAVWEDGLLVASGGKLQYIREVNQEYLDYLETEKGVTDSGYNVGDYIMHDIADSPATCKGVFIRSGRVLVFDDSDTVYYSGVGDEEYWEQDPNDPSTSLFLQIGYKVGGKVLGMVSMASDVLFIKDNGMVFRLQNEYPDWALAELGRNIFCKGAACYCNMGSSTLILGSSALYAIQTTQEYGDMKPVSVGDMVLKELRSLPVNTKLRFVPPLNQVWMLAQDARVLVFDVNTGGFFQRVFNSDAVDVLSVDDEVYVIKKDGVCTLVTAFEDAGQPLEFIGQFKTDFALHDTLVKSVALSITPLKSFYNRTDAVLFVGRIKVPFPLRKPVHSGRERQTVGLTQRALERGSTELYEGDKSKDRLYLNPERLAPGHMITVKVRAIYRGDRVKVAVRGSDFPFFLNYIAYDKVEV